MGCVPKKEAIDWSSLEGMWCQRVTFCPEISREDVTISLNLTVHISEANEEGCSLLICEGTTPLHQGKVTWEQDGTGYVPLIGVKKNSNGEEQPWGITLGINEKGAFWCGEAFGEDDQFFQQAPK